MSAVADAVNRGDSAAFFDAIRDNPDHVFSAELHHENALEPGQPGFAALIGGMIDKGASALSHLFNGAGSGKAPLPAAPDGPLPQTVASKTFKPG